MPQMICGTHEKALTSSPWKHAVRTFSRMAHERCSSQSVVPRERRKFVRSVLLRNHQTRSG